MTTLHGCIPILVTPFDLAGRFVAEDMVRQIDWVIDQGATGVSALAIASEGYKLTDVERDEVAKVVISATAGRVPVVISADGAGTAVAVDRARRAAALGADALMVLPPYFVKPGPAGLQEYYGSIAASVDLPIVIQDAPQLTGVSMSPQLWADLSRDFPNLSYVKAEGTPQGATISDAIRLGEGRISVFSGWGGLGIIDALDRGVVGSMPAPNFTRVFAETQALYELDDRSGAMNLFHRDLPYILWSMQSIDYSVKAAKWELQKRGVFTTDVQRQPATVLDEVSLRQLEEWIDAAVARDA